MIFSGLLIYWSYDPYDIGIGSFTVVHFFPDWFYNVTHIDHKLAYGMAVHFFTRLDIRPERARVRYLHFVSGEWRELAPEREIVRRSAAGDEARSGPEGSDAAAGPVQRGAAN